LIQKTPGRHAIKVECQSSEKNMLSQKDESSSIKLKRLRCGDVGSLPSISELALFPNSL